MLARWWLRLIHFVYRPLSEHAALGLGILSWAGCTL